MASQGAERLGSGGKLEAEGPEESREVEPLDLQPEVQACVSLTAGDGGLARALRPDRCDPPTPFKALLCTVLDARLAIQDPQARRRCAFEQQPPEAIGLEPGRVHLEHAARGTCRSLEHQPLGRRL